jgi:hypothetical protein
VLTWQAPWLSPINESMLRENLTHPAARRPFKVLMRQGIQSLLARAVHFLGRKKVSPSWAPVTAACQSSMRPLAIIGLVTGDEDRRLLAGICKRNCWHLLFAETREEARFALDKVKAPVILCDRDLPGEGWRETVGDLASSSHRACVILGPVHTIAEPR